MKEFEHSTVEYELNTIQIDFPRYTADQIRSEQLLDDELKTIIEDFE